MVTALYIVLAIVSSHYLLATAPLTQDKNVVNVRRHAKIADGRASYGHASYDRAPYGRAPSDAVNHAVACAVYAHMKQYPKAFDECVEALRLQPFNPDFQRNLALLSIEAHQVENARLVILKLSGPVLVLHCLDAMLAYEVGVIFYGDALEVCMPYIAKGFSLNP